MVSVDTFTSGCPGHLSHLADDAGLMIVNHDLEQPLQVQGPVDLVMHLASPSLLGEEGRLRRVLAGPHGTRTALELARDKGARFVFACGTTGPDDEELQGGEALTTAYRHAYGMSTAVARVFDSYGPHMRSQERSTMTTLVQQAFSGGPVLIAGDGSQARSVCYVDDVVSGLLALSRSGAHGVMEFGDPEPRTLLDLARTVVDAAGTQAPFLFVNAATEAVGAQPDISRAREVLGWQPQVALADGVRRTIRAMRESLQGAGLRRLAL
ncbi:dTDP-glucose 4,6-dehydratase [Kineosphaera limosa]|uniref:NAD-dependent epimerase/dehydratase family protein n=1 Tax=Kineosphaera limosa NBRC 100340 TaxID=1184609 RepID=K6WUG8_9MICO|nr:dTDP-glucose 4,6-dehydratase [Kineosphaera limosa]GAB95737.1 NAD-dependent epimerase/dehydratase family protein [Kineosphaera limosa NBRC 100340]